MTKLDQLFENCLAEGRFGGASALVRQRGVIVWRGDFGFRDRERKLNVDGDSIFRLASMTKPVIAASVMMLAERGALDIDDPVSRYLPAFAELQAADRVVSFEDVLEFDPENPGQPGFNLQKLEGIGTVPACRPLTIRHLLGHCGGMGQGPYSNGIYESGIRPEDLMYYGLEYKFVTQHVLGILTYDEMRLLLSNAIHQFAKRQMTWFRGMEKDGITIHWTNV